MDLLTKLAKNLKYFTKTNDNNRNFIKNLYIASNNVTKSVRYAYMFPFYPFFMSSKKDINADVNEGIRRKKNNRNVTDFRVRSELGDKIRSLGSNGTTGQEIFENIIYVLNKHENIKKEIFQCSIRT